MDRLTERNNKNGFLPVLVRGRALGPAYFKEELDYKDYRDALERLAAYEDAEEAGRLVVLPCKPGDALWVTSAYFNKFDIPVKAHVERIEVNREGSLMPVQILVYMDIGSGEKLYGYSPESIGKIIFLTREEAEAAVRRTSSLAKEEAEIIEALNMAIEALWYWRRPAEVDNEQINNPKQRR